ncbi:MAG: AsnC family transcriptional regulator [Thermoleophilaceae bacterium]|nr:AsnC family transcriptional regulator [Thermoleophilaceae bacterium]
MDPITTSAPPSATTDKAAQQRANAAVPKVRTRKDGAAIPLDESDKQLLNLLQSSFPLEPRPFLPIATQLGVSEEAVLKRTQELLDARIIRELTPIFDTRALGYSSLLVAARVDPDNPHRAAKVINAHPGVSHNYLRNHDFNLWFTIATPPDSKLGLERTLEILADEAGADSVRQLPTLKLFKINMNLEMEKGTEILAAPAIESLERSLQPVELTELDYAVIKHLQGQLPVVSEPYAPAAEAIGITVPALLEHLEQMVERGLLRRVAAILFHRRAGFSANGMGVWNVPEDQIATIGPQMASFRGISHCYQRPTYEDWPYSVFTMAHGRSKEECDTILDEIAAATGIEDRSTLYSSTEFKKIRLRYFTDEYAQWEASRL